jgi:two-component sensor histidine kinase
LKEAVARQQLLSGELQHRIKNTLAMVGAIANQTMRGEDVKAAREGFAARLMTLSHAHDILTRTSWTAAPIKEVIDGALAPHGSGPGRIRTSGPDLLLQPKQALALSLAVHELATNAMKYGALSNGSGTVDIVWSEEIIEAMPSFRFTWSESGGPPVSEPAPDRKGFGSRLIERMLTNDFAGKVQISYRPEGAVCELIAPRAALANPSE